MINHTAVPKGTDLRITVSPDGCPYSYATSLCPCPSNIFILGLVKTPLGTSDANSTPTGLSKRKKKEGGIYWLI